MMRVIIALLIAIYGLDVRATSEKRYRHVMQVLPHLKICKIAEKTALETCIAEAIESMSTYLAEGVEELDIPSLEPYLLEKPYEYDFTLDGYRGYAKIRDLKIFGMSKYFVTNLKLLDSVWDCPQVSFVAKFPKIMLKGLGYLNGTLGSPVYVNDTVQLDLDNLEVRINGTVVAAKQFEYFYLPTIIGRYFVAHDIKFRVGKRWDSPLTAFQEDYLRKYTIMVWFQIVYYLELYAAELITTIATNIFSSFKVADLLPRYYYRYLRSINVTNPGV